MSLVKKIGLFLSDNILLITDYIRNNFYKMAFFSGFVYIIYRISPLTNKTQAFYKKTPENVKIFENLQPLNYRPTIWMPFPSLQMLLHESMQLKEVNFKREYIISDDGGEYSLDWAIDDPKEFQREKNKKIFLILHGLTGGSQTIYMRDIIYEMKNLKDFKICVLHNRGINDTPLKTPKSFHASFTKDIKHVLKLLKTRYPECPLYTMGISMGANILTKFFANEYDMGDYVKCFISLSNPFDFHECYNRTKDTLLSYLLKINLRSFFEVNSILRNVREYEENYQRIETFKTHKDLDHWLVTKIHPEFKTADEYYTLSSSKDDIRKLKVRSLFFNANDDILSPIDIVDLKQFEENEKTFLVLTSQGSHICWFTGFFQIRRWFIRKCIDYLLTVSQLEREK